MLYDRSLQYKKSDMFYLFFCERFIDCKVETDQESYNTYRYWTALRFANEDNMSPLRPLNDKFLQNASVSTA